MGACLTKAGYEVGVVSRLSSKDRERVHEVRRESKRNAQPNYSDDLQGVVPVVTVAKRLEPGPIGVEVGRQDWSDPRVERR